MRQILAALAVMFFTSSFAGPVFAQTTSEIAKGNCKAAAEMCQKTVDYCNDKKGNLGKASTINALKDCMDACHATGQFLERGSQLGPKSSAIALEACNECAKVCDQYKDDSQMNSCANECRKAAGNLQKVK
jgi:hypothetical protein